MKTAVQIKHIATTEEMMRFDYKDRVSEELGKIKKDFSYRFYGKRYLAHEVIKEVRLKKMIGLDLIK